MMESDAEGLSFQGAFAVPFAGEMVADEDDDLKHKSKKEKKVKRAKSKDKKTKKSKKKAKDKEKLVANGEMTDKEAEGEQDDTHFRVNKKASKHGQTKSSPLFFEGDELDGFSNPRRPSTNSEFSLKRGKRSVVQDASLVSTEFFNGFAKEDVMRDFHTFTEDQLSVLTSETKSVSMLNQMQNAPSRQLEGKGTIPRDLLVEYLLAMGSDRRTAEELANSFEAEQLAAKTSHISPVAALPAEGSAASAKLREMERLNQPKSPRSKPQPAVGQKLREMDRLKQSSSPSKSKNTKLRELYPSRDVSSVSSVKSSDFVHAPASGWSPHGVVTPQVPEYPSTLSASAQVVEAVPVKENFPDDLPFIYAESSPIKFKHVLQERPIKRAFIMGSILVGVVIAIAVYFSIGRRGGSQVGTTDFPSSSPSSAPTFINPDVLEAAIKLSGEVALSTPDSPQFRATGWLSTVDQVDAKSYNEEFSQRYAIVTIYFSLRGEDWISQEKWLDPTLDECQWSKSISCDYDASGAQVVVALDITRNNCQGQLPAEIGLLTNAEVLKLPKNKISGSIPSSIGLMTSLTTLDLGDNGFIGEIPKTIGGASLISMLDLSRNQLKGSIPLELFDLQLLRTLVLSSNKLSGRIDTAVNMLYSLVTLDVRTNMLTGTFPITVDSIPSLDILYLDYNQFTGPLPALTGGVISKQILSLSHNRFDGNLEVDPTYILSPAVLDDFRLQYTDLSYNQLSGPVSPIIGFFPTLKYFDISGNQFYGTFPSNLAWAKMEYFAAASNSLNGTLPTGQHTLTHLDLGFNRFNDVVPDDYCNYSKLETLILNNNRLGSTIPSCLFDLPNFRQIEIKDSNLNGTIPNEIGQVKGLEIIDLSGNNIGGSIPTEIGELEAVKYLYLDQNVLTGSIPVGIGSLTNLQSLHLAKNLLRGSLPSTIGRLTQLESLTLHDNIFDEAVIPPALCKSSLLLLTVDDVGCDIECSCCDGNYSCAT